MFLNVWKAIILKFRQKVIHRVRPTKDADEMSNGVDPDLDLDLHCSTKTCPSKTYVITVLCECQKRGCVPIKHHSCLNTDLLPKQENRI